MTMGVHTNTVPLSIGLIAKYLQNNLETDIDIKLFKKPTKCVEYISEWKPDILGLAQYLWNSSLNFFVAQTIKNLYPETMIVVGGPNQYLESDERFNYLKNNNFIDVCVAFDGEIPFLDLVHRRIKGESIHDIRQFPSPGTYSLDAEANEIIESKEVPPRINSLNVFGSIYAEGFMDSFLDDGFHPFLQTHRGCPFQCSYCHTSNNYYSKMLFQSQDVFRQDMEYLGKRYKGQHQITLYLANTNFSLFDEDFEIAEVINDVQEKYDWPKIIDVTPGKNPTKLLKLLSMLKYKFTPAISLQTLTPKVLKNIKRKNISLKEFSSFHSQIIKEVNQNTGTELILTLPGETRQSFVDTVEKVLNSGVQNVVIYSLMSLRGTPVSSVKTKKENKHLIRYRLVPSAFSEINSEKIFETEEVVVGSKDMSFNDYLELRGLAIIITVFMTSTEFFPIRKFIMENKLDIAKWIFNIHNHISDYPKLNSIYLEFIKETNDELFMSHFEIIHFYNVNDNYKQLCMGKLGDNLLRKYKMLFLSKFFQLCLKIALTELRNIIGSIDQYDNITQILSNLEIFLKTRDVGCLFENGYVQEMEKKFDLAYDIPAWINDKDNGSLKNFAERCSYKTIINDYMKHRLKTFDQMNKNKTLSKQILYRDGYIKDLWPKWIRIE